MTEQRSMLEYLASLRQHGATPQNIGDVTIGRTVYAAGSFIDHGRKRIALMPMYRTDWVSRDSAGPTPELLPASARRSSRILYVDNHEPWFISGWNPDEGVLWLDRGAPGFFIDNPRLMPIAVHWRESFETSLRLASPEVLLRIAGPAAALNRWVEQQS